MKISSKLRDIAAVAADEFRTVYQAVTMDEYRAMQKAYVFPIPRAIAVYKGS